ncbi:MAG TPA: hypothetical protein VK022_00665 [Paracoccaceae bacterium]|nr:hypothetical protein [Paracoccaceae bacterium]
MKLPFLRTPQHDEEPLVVAMTGARLGDSVVFAGRSPALVLPLASRTGLSGRLLVLAGGSGADPFERAAAKHGVLLEIAAAPPEGAPFDLAVVEAVDQWQEVATRLRPSVRPGGRVVVIAGREMSGFSRWFRPAETGPSDPEVIAALERAGWQRIRPIGQRDGLRFVEAFA